MSCLACTLPRQEALLELLTSLSSSLRGEQEEYPPHPVVRSGHGCEAEQGWDKACLLGLSNITVVAGLLPSGRRQRRGHTVGRGTGPGHLSRSGRLGPWDLLPPHPQGSGSGRPQLRALPTLGPFGPENRSLFLKHRVVGWGQLLAGQQQEA